MASDAFITTIIQTGVTGAGFVPAIYALIIPLSKRIFSYKAEDIIEKSELFKEKYHPKKTRRGKKL